MRRITMCGLATAAAWAAMVGAAGAATTTPGPFRFVATDGRLVQGTLGAVGVKPVVISGTVDGSGHLSANATDALFPSVEVPVPDSLVQTLAAAVASSGQSGTAGLGSVAGAVSDVRLVAGLSTVGNVTGTVDPATGAASLTLSVNFGLTISAKALGVFTVNIDCGISPIPFTLGTTTVTVPGALTPLVGSPFGAADGAVAFTGTSQAPAPSCKVPEFLTKLLGDQLDAVLGPLTGALGQAGPVGLRLSGRLDLPAAPAPTVTVTTSKTTTDPGAGTGTPRSTSGRGTALAALAGGRTVKVTGTAVPVRISCRSQECAGTVRLTSTGSSPKTLGSASYDIAAGRTRTVRIPLRASARTALRKTGSRKVRAVVTVVGGTGATRSMTLKGKRAARKVAKQAKR